MGLFAEVLSMLDGGSAVKTQGRSEPGIRFGFIS